MIHGARLLWLDRRLARRGMIGTNFIYGLAGLVFAVFAVLAATDRGNRKRFGNAGFYGLLAVSFLLGDRIGDIGNGVLVLGLVAIAGTGAMGRGARATTGPVERQAESERRGNRLFLPALVIPATALLGTLAFKAMPALVDPKQITLVALACGVILALAAGYAWFRARPATPFLEGLRLMDSVGWAAVLPQMLASLGAVFALAGGRAGGRRARGGSDSGRQPDRRGAGLCARDDRVHDGDGECVCGLPGDVRRGRDAAANRAFPRRSRGDRGDRNARGLLRHADDADGGGTSISCPPRCST